MVTVNTEIEVTKDQFRILVSNLSGIIAHRKENDKYYIKCMWSKYCPIVDKILLK
jgi:hypothetical protein